MISIRDFYCYVGGGVSFFSTKLTKKHKGHKGAFREGEYTRKRIVRINIFISFLFFELLIYKMFLCDLFNYQWEASKVLVMNII
jgi:hypothetical protein